MNHSTTSQFSLPPRGSFQVTVEILVTCSLVLFGACGNALVFVAVWKEKSLRTIPNVFVVNLAVTDFLFSTTVLPLTTSTFIQGEWKLGMRGCELQGFMFGAVLIATLVTMTAISINRFIMIRHRTMYRKVYTKKKVCFMLIAIWCYAILFASRPFYGLGRYVFNPYNAVCSIDKKPESASKISRIVVYLTLYANIIIIIGCYVGIYRTVSQHRRQMKTRQLSNPSRATNSRALFGEDIHIAKTMFIVIGLFGLCWFPTAITGIVVIFSVSIPGLAQEFLMFSVCLASVVNPIVYAIRNRRFKETFKRVIEMHFSTHNSVERTGSLANRLEQLQTTL